MVWRQWCHRGGWRKSHDWLSGECVDLERTGRVGIAGGTGAFYVPAGAPDIVYSVQFEPGTGNCQTIGLNIYNATKSSNFNNRNMLVSQVADRGKLPQRYVYTITAASNGYEAGDALSVYLYPQTEAAAACTGTSYVSKALVNVGNFPSIFHPTSGTAEVPGSAGWLTPVEKRRDLFDLVVVQWGRNDGNSPTIVPAFDYERMLSAMIDGALTVSGRVLVTTPPPRATADLLGWESADNYQTAGHHAAAKRTAARHGVLFYDAVADYKALATAGTYTIAQLMRDIYHPTDTSNSAGIGRDVAAIAEAFASAPDNMGRPNGPGPVVRLGGQVTSGTWAWTRFYCTTGPAYDAFGLLVGEDTANACGALVSSHAGDTLTYSVKGRAIGVIVLADATGGTINVAVDGRAPVSINTTNTGLSFYANGQFVAGDLENITHTVTVAVASGQARVVGVVAAP